MPLYESEHQRRSRIYREQQASIAKNMRRQTEMMEEDRRAARSAAYRASERAAKERRRDNFFGLVGGVAGVAGWALQKDAARQARAREAGAHATAAAPSNPSAHKASSAEQQSRPAQGPQEPTLFDLPAEDIISEEVPKGNLADAEQQPIQGVDWAALPWGIFSVVASALFFFAPITSIAGIVLGVIGLRYNSNGRGQQLQRTLSLVGIGVGGFILIAIAIITALLNAVGTVLSGGMG